VLAVNSTGTFVFTFSFLRRIPNEPRHACCCVQDSLAPRESGANVLAVFFCLARFWGREAVRVRSRHAIPKNEGVLGLWRLGDSADSSQAHAPRISSYDVEAHKEDFVLREARSKLSHSL